MELQHLPSLQTPRLMSTTVAAKQSLAARVETVFGDADDPIDVIDARAEEFLPEYRILAWEADAASLECTYIGKKAVEILGYPPDHWTGRAGFWAKAIHPEDRDEALANCALCAGRGRGHNFSYRAVSADGSEHRFYNVLRVVHGKHKLAVRLRGILIEVDDVDTFLDGTSPLHQIKRQ